MKELEQWATTTWAIWNARNRAQFEKLQTQPQTILDGSIALLTSYHTLTATQENIWWGDKGSTVLWGGYMFFHWYKEKLAWVKCFHFLFTLYTKDITINEIFLSVISKKKKKKKFPVIFATLYRARSMVFWHRDSWQLIS